MGIMEMRGKLGKRRKRVNQKDLFWYVDEHMDDSNLTMAHFDIVMASMLNGNEIYNTNTSGEFIKNSYYVNKGCEEESISAAFVVENNNSVLVSSAANASQQSSPVKSTAVGNASLDYTLSVTRFEEVVRNQVQSILKNELRSLSKLEMHTLLDENTARIDDINQRLIAQRTSS